MKNFYSLTTIAIALFFAQSSSAQVYNGGHYTAHVAGLWHGNPTPVWDAEPSPTCDNCLIEIDVHGVLQLNVSQILKNGSKLLIASGSTLVINNSGNSTIPSAYNILLSTIGTENLMQLADNSSVIDAGNAGIYDGVLTITPNSDNTNTYLKELGIAPLLITPNPASFNWGPAAFSKSTTGPSVLSSIGTLPIILSGFNAILREGNVDLSWTTQMEMNSDHMAVLRSTDAGAHWSTIGTVAAHGNSSTALNYSFADDNPAAGTSQYRLQLVDRDGKYAYSEVKTVRNGMITSVGIYPNPARDYVNVTLGGSATQNATVRLLSQSGQLLVERTATGAAGTIVTLPVSSYPQGNYLVVVIGADGSKQVSKLLIAK